MIGSKNGNCLHRDTDKKRTTWKKPKQTKYFQIAYELLVSFQADRLIFGIVRKTSKKLCNDAMHWRMDEWNDKIQPDAPATPAFQTCKQQQQTNVKLYIWQMIALINVYYTLRRIFIKY